MKNLKPMRSFALLLICFFSLPLAFATHRAQAENEGQPVLNMPLKYLQPVELAEPLVVDGRTYYYESPAPGDELDMRRYWYVWSDRQDNPSYTTFDGATEQEQLGFLQPLAVLELRGNRLRVACKNDIELDDKGMATLPAGKTDLGWVDYANLLLWFHAVRSYPFKIEKKALIVNVFDPENPGQGYPEIYPKPHPPGDDDTRRDGETVHNYEILLVYKETEHDYLVGVGPRILDRSETNAGDVIRGWVSKCQAKPWNHRAGVEWDWETSPERIKRNNLARLWREPDHMPQADHYYQEDASRPYVRMPGIEHRFILFDDVVNYKGFEYDEPVRIRYVGRKPFGEKEDTLNIALRQAAFSVAKRFRNINIVFVIDASYSMEMYSEPVAQALARVMDAINEREELRPPDMRKTYRFGALVFRDEPDEFVIHYSNQGHLTLEPEVINAFLKDKMDPDYNVRSRDLPGSMFYGIEQAMQVFEPNPQHTNYTIIIGDAGDHQNRHGKPRTYRTAEQVVYELSAVNSNVIACQVFHNQRISPITGQMVPADTIYETFQTQLKHIMLETAKRIAGDDGQVDHDNIRWAETAANTFALQNAPLIGELVVPNVNDSIPMNMLEEMLTDRINVIDTITNRAIDSIIETIISGGAIDLYDADRAEMDKTIQMLREVIMVILEEDPSIIDLIWDILFHKPPPFRRELYTYLEFDGISWFQPVLLYSSSELLEMIDMFSIFDGEFPDDDEVIKTALVNAWDALINHYLGETDSAIKNGINKDDIRFWLTGAGASVTRDTMTYHDLKNTITTEEIRHLADEYSRFVKELQRVHQLGSEYEGYQAGSVSDFYWIPYNVFP